MGFIDIPSDLQNIVSEFAWDCRWVIAEKDLNECLNVKRMNISSVFTRDYMWSYKYNSYLPNPMIAFEPICNFTHEWGDYIDWHSVQELLWRLDFRRRYVKLVNSRIEWRILFKEDWKTIKFFDAFYRFLLYTRVPCFKPVWKDVGFNCLTQGYRSPFKSARWWLREII